MKANLLTGNSKNQALFLNKSFHTEIFPNGKLSLINQEKLNNNSDCICKSVYTGILDRNNLKKKDPPVLCSTKGNSTW